MQHTTCMPSGDLVTECEACQHWQGSSRYLQVHKAALVSNWTNITLSAYLDVAPKRSCIPERCGCMWHKKHTDSTACTLCVCWSPMLVSPRSDVKIAAVHWCHLRCVIVWLRLGQNTSAKNTPSGPGSFLEKYVFEPPEPALVLKWSILKPFWDFFWVKNGSPEKGYPCANPQPVPRAPAPIVYLLRAKSPPSLRLFATSPPCTSCVPTPLPPNTRALFGSWCI